LALRFELAQLALHWGLAETFDALAALAEFMPAGKMDAGTVPANGLSLTWRWMPATRPLQFAGASTASGNSPTSTRTVCSGPEKQSPMRICCHCAKPINGKVLIVNPPRLIQMSLDFNKAFHSRCYKKAKKGAVGLGGVPFGLVV
jgi:hypothetical protein